MLFAGSAGDWQNNFRSAASTCFSTTELHSQLPLPFFEAGSRKVAEASLKLAIFLPRLSELLVYGHVLPCLRKVIFIVWWDSGFTALPIL